MGGEKNDLALGIIVNGSARRPKNRDIKNPIFLFPFPRRGVIGLVSILCASGNHGRI